MYIFLPLRRKRESERLKKGGRDTQGLFPFQILIEKITNVTNKYPILFEKEEDCSAGKGGKKEKKKGKILCIHRL